VRADEVISVRALVSGSRVLRGARLARLADSLAIVPQGEVELFLATEDVLVVFGERSGIALAIHISANEGHLSRQRAGIEMAHDVFADLPAVGLIPRVIEWRPLEGGWALLEERLAGRTVDPLNLSAQELETYIEAALKPLLWLDSRAEAGQGDADQQVIFDRLRWLECHPVLATPTARPLEALRRWPGRVHSRTVFAHGDYWFPNLLFATRGAPVLTGIIDWERCRSRALPGADALYLVVFAFSRWRGCSQFKVLREIWEGNPEPLLERLLERLCTDFRLALDDLRFVALLIWLMHLRLRGPSMSEWPVGRHEEWVAQPAASIERWLKRSESSPRP
jgi:hypothetical protein